MLASYNVGGWVSTKMDILGYHIAGVVGLGALFAAVYGAFAKFDGDQSDDNRKFVRDWLLGLKVDGGRWASFFQELFARAFGSRHLSLKCIRRSALLSVILVGTIYLYWVTRGAGATLYNYISYVAWSVFVAVVADYFSLWKTRVILTKPKLFQNSIVAIVVVVVDVLATILIYGIVFTIVLEFVEGRGMSIPTVEGAAVGLTNLFSIAFSWPVISADVGWFGAGIVRSLLLPPLFTSAWLWIYLIVAYGMRALTYVPGSLKAFSKVSDFDAHPVRSIGYVAASVSTAIVAIMMFV